MRYGIMLGGDMIAQTRHPSTAKHIAQLLSRETPNKEFTVRDGLEGGRLIATFKGGERA